LIAQALRRPGAELVALALVLLLAALLALRGAGAGLTYDEGTYLLSVLDLKGGQALGTDVFAPQPPLFYDLVRLSAWVFGPGVEEVRRGIVVVLLAGVLGAYLLVRGLVGPWAGVAAAALLVVAPPIPLDAARVHADLPALALMLLALGLAAERRGGPRTQVALGFAAGAVLAVAVGVKLTALIGVVPLALLLLRSRPAARPARSVAAAAGALLVLLVVLVVYRDALGSLWTGLVDYRRAARRTPNLVGGREILDIVLDLHAAFTIAFLLGAVLAVTRLVRERSWRRATAVVPVLLLAVLGALALATYRPLHLNHLVLGATVLAVLAATLIGWGAAGLPARGQVVVAGLVCVLALGAFSQGWRRAGTELAPPDPDAVRLAGLLARTAPADALVVSDNPGIAYLARRRVPGSLVDTARLRFETGSLTDAAVLETIDRSCAVAVVAARTFLLHPHLLAGFEERFGRQQRAGEGRLYSSPRRQCPAGA
jgi:4-amino-4-deoxy-L-arabinose transferase-like glycosyltransferase